MIKTRSHFPLNCLPWNRPNNSWSRKRCGDQAETSPLPRWAWAYRGKLSTNVFARPIFSLSKSGAAFVAASVVVDITYPYDLTTLTSIPPILCQSGLRRPSLCFANRRSLDTQILIFFTFPVYTGPRPHLTESNPKIYCHPADLASFLKAWYSIYLVLEHQLLLGQNGDGSPRWNRSPWNWIHQIQIKVLKGDNQFKGVNSKK